MLKTKVSPLPESAFTFSGKQNTTEGGMVSPSELVLLRSLMLTVLQHYAALYVCSVRLASRVSQDFMYCTFCEVYFISGKRFFM
jgi:hypothetical protein